MSAFVQFSINLSSTQFKFIELAYYYILYSMYFWRQSAVRSYYEILLWPPLLLFFCTYYMELITYEY